MAMTSTAQLPGALSAPRILVVEDNYLLASTICDVVRESGFAVAGPVSRLETAVDMLARGDIDGALVDINLCGTDSYSLCSELRERRVPFAFITGYDRASIPQPFQDT